MNVKGRGISNKPEKSNSISNIPPPHNFHFTFFVFPIISVLIGLIIGYYIGLSQPKHLDLKEFAKIKYSIDKFCIANGYLRGGYLVFNDSEILVRCINISYTQRADFKIENIKLS